ncbi:MAG: hypothetical protein HKL89_07830 [Candidatus Dormibacteraeota bacterium]|nr:hypothetical protein [Candidatus Dormibacteraeota bacterium]
MREADGRRLRDVTRVRDGAGQPGQQAELEPGYRAPRRWHYYGWRLGQVNEVALAVAR